jgi:hypothetical protein
MAGHGSPRPEDTGSHPNRQVGLPEGQRLSWPEVRARQDAASATYRAARDAGTLPTYDSGGWTARHQLDEDMRHDRQMGNG